MSFSLLISEEAEADIANAFLWYNDIKPTLADEFLSNLDLIFEKITLSPYLFAVNRNNIRGASVEKFPFIIFYRITEKDIEVFSVFHKKRKPKTWKTRKK